MSSFLTTSNLGPDQAEGDPPNSVSRISVFPGDRSIRVEWNMVLPDGTTATMTGGYLMCLDREHNRYSVIDLSVCEAEEKCYTITTLDGRPLVNGRKYTVQYNQLLSDGSQLSTVAALCIPRPNPQRVYLHPQPTLTDTSGDGSMFNVTVQVDNPNSDYSHLNSVISFKLMQVHEDLGVTFGDDANAAGGVDYRNDILTRTLTVNSYDQGTAYVLLDIPKGHYKVCAIYSNTIGVSPVSNMVDLFAYLTPNNVTVQAQSGNNQSLPFTVASTNNPNAPTYKIVATLTSNGETLGTIDMLLGTGLNTWQIDGAGVISGSGAFTGLNNRQVYMVSTVALTAGIDSNVAICNDNDMIPSATPGTSRGVPATFAPATVRIDRTDDGTFVGYSVLTNGPDTFDTNRYSITSNLATVLPQYYMDRFGYMGAESSKADIEEQFFGHGLIIRAIVCNVIPQELVYAWESPPLNTPYGFGSDVNVWCHPEVASDPLVLPPTVSVQAVSNQESEVPFTISCPSIYKIDGNPDLGMIVRATLFKDGNSVGDPIDLTYNNGWTIVSGSQIIGGATFSGLMNGVAYTVSVCAITSDNSYRSKNDISNAVTVAHGLGSASYIYNNTQTATGYSITDPVSDSFDQVYDVDYYDPDGNVVEALSQLKISANPFIPVDNQYLVNGSSFVVTQYDIVPSGLVGSWEFPTEGLTTVDGVTYWEHLNTFGDTLIRYDPPNAVTELQVNDRTKDKLKTISWLSNWTRNNKPTKFTIKIVDADGLEVYTYDVYTNSASLSGDVFQHTANMLLIGPNPFTVSVTAYNINRQDVLISSAPTTLSSFRRDELQKPDVLDAYQLSSTTNVVLAASANIYQSIGYESIDAVADITITRNGTVVSTLTDAVVNNSENNYIVPGVQYNDVVTAHFRTRALFADYPEDADNHLYPPSPDFVYSSYVEPPSVITVEPVKFSNLQFTQDADLRGHGTFTWTPPETEPVASISYSYTITVGGVTSESYPLSESEASSASFSINVQLDVEQTLTLTLTTSYNSSSADYPQSVTYTPAYTPISIVSNTWTKFTSTANIGNIRATAVLNRTDGYYVSVRYTVKIKPASSNFSQTYNLAGGGIDINKGEEYTLTLKAYANIENGYFPVLAVESDDFVQTFTWATAPTIFLRSAARVGSGSSITFDVLPNGAAITGIIGIVIPSVLTNAQTISFVLSPPYNMPITQSFDYDIFPNLVANKDDVSLLLVASNAEGLGQLEQNLCPA